MAKKVSKILQGRITPSGIQLDWIGIKEGEYVIIQDDDGKHGHFLSVYAPEKKEDKGLAEDYKNKREE